MPEMHLRQPGFTIVLANHLLRIKKESKNKKNRNSRYIYIYIYIYIFNCYLADPRPTLGHSQGDSLTNPMLIAAFYLIRPEGHREPRNEVGSLSPAERLAGFEPGTFRF